nr:MAG TPA: hypothetical protein [Caudoviricetes sp.]
MLAVLWCVHDFSIKSPPPKGQPLRRRVFGCFLADFLFIFLFRLLRVKIFTFPCAFHSRLIVAR